MEASTPAARAEQFRPPRAFATRLRRRRLLVQMQRANHFGRPSFSCRDSGQNATEPLQPAVGSRSSRYCERWARAHRLYEQESGKPEGSPDLV